MSDHRLFYWCVGEDGDIYFGGFRTLEEAMQNALNDETLDDSDDMADIFLCSAVRSTINFGIFDADLLIERLAEVNEELAHPDDGTLTGGPPTSQQKAELEEALASAFRSWATKHDLCKAFVLADLIDLARLTPAGLRAHRAAACSSIDAPLVIWGEAGTGKTRHAAALAKHYGKDVVIDEGAIDGRKITVGYVKQATADTLILTQTRLEGAIYINDALRAAGIPVAAIPECPRCGPTGDEWCLACPHSAEHVRP